MTPQELLNRETETVSHLLEHLIGVHYNHIPESKLESWDVNGLSSDRLEVKIYKCHWFDSRRCWKLCSVWLDNIPVLICCNAGREGDDYYQKYLLDINKYREMVTLVQSLALQSVEIEVGAEVTALDKDIPEMTAFYNANLDGWFERY